MRTTLPILAMPILALSLAACGGKPADEPVNAAVANFTPPAVRPATPVAGQAQTTPLTAYVGKYPHDAVAGVDFYDRTEVANGLIDAVGDDKLRALIRGRSGPETPIFALGTRIGAWGCEAHNCGDHNWTLLIDAKGGKAEACHHDAATMGETSRWYAGAAPTTRPGSCPAQDGAAG